MNDSTLNVDENLWLLMIVQLLIYAIYFFFVER